MMIRTTEDLLPGYYNLVMVAPQVQITPKT